METDLITALAQFGPWGAAAALIVFLRKEIAAVLSAPKEDRAVERLLSGMNEHLVTNLKLFGETNTKLGETNTKLEAMRAVLVEILAVNRDIHTELVRRK